METGYEIIYLGNGEIDFIKVLEESDGGDSYEN